MLLIIAQSKKRTYVQQHII